MCRSHLVRWSLANYQWLPYELWPPNLQPSYEFLMRCIATSWKSWVIKFHLTRRWPSWEAFCSHGLTLIPAGINDNMYLTISKLQRQHCSSVWMDNYTPTKLLGGILVSLRLSVRPSVRPASRVRSVTSTVQDGFFPYLVQMINSMRGCVACDGPWPWPISSRSFGLALENRVRSVASTVLDWLFLYLAQMIVIIRGCVACYNFFRIWEF